MKSFFTIELYLRVSANLSAKDHSRTSVNWRLCAVVFALRSSGRRGLIVLPSPCIDRRPLEGSFDSCLATALALHPLQTGGRLRDQKDHFREDATQKKEEDRRTKRRDGNLINSPDFLELDRGDEGCVQDFVKSGE